LLALRALTADERHPSLTSRAHHDRSGQAHARAQSLRRGNRRAAVGRHVHPPTSPTTRATVAPEKARPPRITVAVTAGIKRPGSLPSKDDPRAARARGSKNPTLEGCECQPVVSKPAQRSGCHRCPRYMRITDQRLTGRYDLEPSSLADAKSWEHPAATPQWPY
jgi:hypothetical protein